jgi:hypothetical protein
MGVSGDEQEQHGDLIIQTPNQPSSFPIWTGPLDKGEHGHDNRISSKGKVREADGGMKAGPSGDFPQRLVNPIDQALDSDASGRFSKRDYFFTTSRFSSKEAIFIDRLGSDEVFVKKVSVSPPSSFHEPLESCTRSSGLGPCSTRLPSGLSSNDCRPRDGGK